jgi:diguanylate cyclase (GGDEF)-like protein
VDHITPSTAFLRRQAVGRGILARIGGKEFAVVLPRTRPLAALAICDLVRAQVSSGPLIVGKLALSVTASGGVSELGPAGLDEALKAAERALLDARIGGRNQLRLAA